LLVSCGSAKQAAEPQNEVPLVETPPAIIEPAELLPKDMKDPHWPVPIMYHLIMEDPYSKWDTLFVRPGEFDAHLSKMADEGYDFVFADEYKIHDGKSVALTFDDGYLDNYTTAFPLLEKYNAKATIFIIEDKIGTDGYLSEEQIKEMADSGRVHFGCHTKTHSEIPSLKEDTLRKEIVSCKERIEEITGKPCNAFAYPGGKYSKESVSVIEDYFDSAYTTEGGPSKWPTNSLIPRVYAARGDSAEALVKKVDKMSKKLTVNIEQ